MKKERNFVTDKIGLNNFTVGQVLDLPDEVVDVLSTLNIVVENDVVWMVSEVTQ